MLALISYIVFLCAWFFPGPVYSAFVHEPDLLWLDPLTIAYFTACVVAFVLGVHTVHHSRARQQLVYERWISVNDPIVYLLLPLAIAIVFCALYIREVGTHIDFLALLQSQRANVVKQAQVADQLDVGRFGYSIPVLAGTVWWAAYRSRQVSLEGIDRWAFRGCFILAIAVGVVASFALADRGTVLMFIVGVIIVSLYGRSLDGTKLGKLAAVCIVSAGVILVVFLSLAFMRGTGTVKGLTGSFMGYSIASYNRQAALLSGKMTYEYHGTGVYLAPYLNDRHKLNSVLPIAQHMGWPTYIEVWRSEFRSVETAGLNPEYIWSGEFGYLYSDLGWGALLYLFAAGAMVGYAWRRFRAGGSIAILVYPFTAFWILFWVTSTSLFDHPLVEFLEVGIVLMLWDKLWIGPSCYIGCANAPSYRVNRRPIGSPIGDAP